MIGFISRWGQLSRRYLWPHLLLGIVAAGFGLPFTSGSSQILTPFSLANTFTVSANTRFEHLTRLREMTRRPTFFAGYWQQHALRVVIRNLSFSLPVQQQQTENCFEPLTVKSLAVLYSLVALLAVPTWRADCRVLSNHYRHFVLSSFSTALWLSAVRGIRAGPMRAKEVPLSV